MLAPGDRRPKLGAQVFFRYPGYTPFPNPNMYRSLLDYLRCARCRGVLELHTFTSSIGEIENGILYCRGANFFPVAGGVPRFLPGALEEHWASLGPLIPSPPPEPLRPLLSPKDEKRAVVETFGHDRRTQANFSHEWQHHEVGDRSCARPRSCSRLALPCSCPSSILARS